MKYLAFRLDIDSVPGAQAGLPALLAIARELNVRFTLFVNMGVPFALTEVPTILFKRMIKKTGQANSTGGVKLPALAKLSIGDILRCVTTARRFNHRSIRLIKMAADEGHEIGLHGGGNHYLWQNHIDHLSVSELQRLFMEGWHSFIWHFGRQPLCFASPGFSCSQGVLDILDEFGFMFASDYSGSEPFQIGVGKKRYQHWQVPVNIRDGNVPLVESLWASGYSEQDIVQTCLNHLSRHQYAVAFGHPEGEGRCPGAIRSMLSLAIERGYRVVTMGKLLSEWKSDHNSPTF